MSVLSTLRLFEDTVTLSEGEFSHDAVLLNAFSGCMVLIALPLPEGESNSRLPYWTNIVDKVKNEPGNLSNRCEYAITFLFSAKTAQFAGIAFCRINPDANLEIQGLSDNDPKFEIFRGTSYYDWKYERTFFDFSNQA